MRLKMKSRPQRYDIYRPRPRHGQKYTQYKMCLSIIMVISIKQHLSNIWSSVHEEVKQHYGWVKKKHVMAPVAISKAGKTSIFLLNQIQGKMRSITVMYYWRKWFLK